MTRTCRTRPSFRSPGATSQPITPFSSPTCRTRLRRSSRISRPSQSMRMTRPPQEYATLCDITCDSDGIVDKFVDLHDVKQVLELHSLVEGEPYYLAFALVGAYQEVMGNSHNLFGVPNEAHIHIDEDGYLIKKVVQGTTVGEALKSARYERGQLHEGFRRQIAQRVKRGELTEAEGAELVEFYEARFNAYTYLGTNGKEERGRRGRE